MKRQLLTMFMASLCLANTSSAWAQALHVAPNGNDRNPGTMAQPFRRVQKAVSVAKPGDVLLVEDGDYQESILFPRSGSADAWITLRPRNLVDVHMAPPRVKISPRPGATAITLQGHSYLRIEGLDVNGGLWGIATSGTLGHHTVVTNNLVHDLPAIFSAVIPCWSTPRRIVICNREALPSARERPTTAFRNSTSPEKSAQDRWT